MHRRAPVLAGLAFPALAAAASAQTQRPFYSIDWHGQTIAVPDLASTTPITEADILLPPGGVAAFGPLAAPEIAFTGGDLGLANYGPCVGHQPGTACGIEVDALSFGDDDAFTDQQAEQPRVWFSVDEYGVGVFIAAGPSVSTESFVGDSSPDLFVDLGLPIPPIGPVNVGQNTGALDGNGEPSASGFLYPGIGIVEPNQPNMNLPDTGDNVDAFDLAHQPMAAAAVVYFSLDAGFGDALTGAANSNSAAFSGAQGADVLRKAIQGGPFVVYAPATMLGLDLQGPGTDDLDALILRENGVPNYQVSSLPFDWLGGQTDMLVFSVRRNSAVVGQPDSIFGQPIEPGDLLIPPVLGGPNQNPGIFIAAEALGLQTQRQFPMAAHGDDLNASDAEFLPYLDCNNNGIEDSVDIATGASSDNNMNGIPDECEVPGAGYCYCPPPLGPCGNFDSSAGCANSTGQGAEMAGTGSSSVVLDDLVLSTSNVPPNQFGLTFMGDVQHQLPLGDGLICVSAGNHGIHRFPVQHSGPQGAIELGPGIASLACQLFPPAACIEPGTTWNFQTWYRDPAGPCGATSSFSNAWEVTFTP